MSENENMVTVDKYFKYLEKKKLMGSKCPECGNIDLPPHRLCSKCLNETKWVQLSGKGILKTFSSIFVGAKVMTKKGYDRKNPYVFAVCEMEEGPMVSGLLTEVDGKKPEEIQFGMSVESIYLESETEKKDRKGNVIKRWDVAFKPLE